MDQKQKNLLIGGAIMTLVIVTAIGIAVWVLSGNKEEKPQTPGFENSTPGAAIAQQVGSVAISPEQIQLARGPDGRLSAIATVSALFQDFTPTSITFEGDPNLSSKTDCPHGAALKAGTRCQVSISYAENANAGALTTPTPSLVVVGESTTPGGQKITVEARATIGGRAPGDGAPEVAGQPPVAANAVLTSGPAPAGIDPYGPVAPNASAQPVDYTQAAVPQNQPTLSAREQFILARRQAVLGNVVHRSAATQQPISTGDWDEIKVPKVVSSAPQDMSRVVTMDRVITAVLSRSFDSRASQQVVAQVDRNVYGATGRTILIPRGSTVIGTMTGGAERAVVNWTQIIRPDGARFVMAATGGDAMGQAGVPGNVNNRFMKRFSSVLLGTLFKAGTAVASNAQERPSSGGVNIGDSSGSAARNNGAIVTDIISQDINQIVQQMVAQNQAIQPIVTVPAGTRVTIVPQQDLVMRPVERQTIVRPSYPRQMNGGAQAPSFNIQTGADEDVQERTISFDQPQQAPRQQQRDTNVVARGLSQTTPATLSSTPPWSSN